MRNGLAAFNYFENGMFTLCFDNKPFFFLIQKCIKFLCGIGTTYD